MVSNYLAEINSVISRYKGIIADETMNQKIYNDKQLTVYGSIRFINNNTLRYAEVIDAEAEHVFSYKFQYINPENETIFQYDNALRPEKNRATCHYTYTSGVLSASEGKPDLQDVLKEISTGIETSG
jgi:hypothetical protein